MIKNLLFANCYVPNILLIELRNMRLSYICLDIHTAPTSKFPISSIDQLYGHEQELVPFWCLVLYYKTHTLMWKLEIFGGFQNFLLSVWDENAGNTSTSKSWIMKT